MKLIILIAIAICLHSLIALYIDKYKIIEEDEITNYALIPFINLYLLGKYVFNEIIGIALFIFSFFVVDFNIVIFKHEYGIEILPTTTRIILFIIYVLIIIITLIYGIKKYNVLTGYKDKFDIDDIIYYLKETIWITIFFIAIYLFAMFIIGAGTGVISI